MSREFTEATNSTKKYTVHKNLSYYANLKHLAFSPSCLFLIFSELRNSNFMKISLIFAT